MPNTPSGSFIPKRTTRTPKKGLVVRRVYIFTYIAYTIFFGVVIAAGGVTFLKVQAEKAQEAQITRIEEARSSFSLSDIAEVRELDARLEKARDILEEHAAPSRIFAELESVVTRNIQLTNFEYTNGLGENARIAFTGSADTFDAVLFQRTVFMENPLLASADFVSVTYGSQAPTPFQDFRDSSPQVIEILPIISFEFEKETPVSLIAYDPSYVPAPSPVVETEETTEDTEGSLLVGEDEEDTSEDTEGALSEETDIITDTEESSGI